MVPFQTITTFPAYDYPQKICMIILYVNESIRFVNINKHNDWNVCTAYNRDFREQDVWITVCILHMHINW